jgi:hypothetical protein
MNNTFRFGLLAVIILIHFGEAQSITTRPFPAVPNDWFTKGLVEGNGSIFLVTGAVKKESMIFDDIYGFEVPSFFVSGPASNGSVVYLPDTNKYLLRSFDSRRQIITVDAAMGPENVPVIAWSTMPEEGQDYFPFITYTLKCTTKTAFINDGALSDIRWIQNAINPSVVSSGDVHGPRIVYEKITPLDTLPGSAGDSLQFRFTRYRSQIYMEIPYTKSLALFELLSVGKGFFPDVKRGADGALYVLWFEADSNTAPTAAVKYRRADYVGGSGPVYTVIPEKVMPKRWTFEQQPMEWEVDSSGALILCDRPRRIIRHHSTTGVTIDSLSTSNKFLVDIDILPNGTVHALWGEEWAALSRYHLYYSSSQHQKLFTNERSLGDVPYKDHSLLVTDRNNKTHLIRTGADPMLLMNLSGGDSVVQRFTGYSLLTDPVIDSSNALWTAARKDSTLLFLRCDLNEPLIPDFYFPMNIGDEWQFLQIQGQSIADWELYSIKALKDSVALNGKKYLYYSDGQFLRKDGLKVFSFVPQDSMEYLQYDFSKKSGDTITIIPGQPAWRSVVLEAIDTTPFGRTFRFTGNVSHQTLMRMWRSAVTDSIGFTGMQCLICEAMFSFQGALVNGKRYGTIVSAGRTPEMLPEKFALAQNYPNPFNPTTRIEYALPKHTFVTLRIFDVIGREVATVVNEEKPGGRYVVDWNGRNSDGQPLASGVYFYRLHAGGFTHSKKMILLK